MRRVFTKHTALIIRAVRMLAVSFFIMCALPVPTFAANTNNCNGATGSSYILKANDIPGPHIGCVASGQEPVIALILKLIFGLMSTIALIFVAIGAFKYTVSGGSSEAIASAKKTILYAVLGLFLGISAFTRVGLVIKWVG